MEVKKQYQDCILFFRMGDFYEMFLEDAKIGARVLDITLTSRSKGKEGRIPMAGVPYHAVDSYLNKMVKAGYKVAICEQLTPPNKQGIVKRDVIRIVTPGTLLDENALDRKRNNYIITVSLRGKSPAGDFRNIGLAIADISTGFFQTAEYAGERAEQVLLDELSRLLPAECVLSEEDYNNPDILRLLTQVGDMNIFPYIEWDRYARRAEAAIKEIFHVNSLGVFDIDAKKYAQQASAALLHYLIDTQKGQVSHIKKIALYSSEDTMQLDRSTIANLELFITIREGERRGSLLHVLDDTVTPMGSRLLRRWVMKPLIDRDKIIARHDCVELFLRNRKLRTEIRTAMGDIYDVERIVARLSTNLGNAKDLIALKNSLIIMGEIGDRVATLPSPLAGELARGVDKEIGEIVKFIAKFILPDPAFDPKNGNLIERGVNSELDELRTTVRGGKDWIVDLEQKERERTGISTLKVRFNKVFGFYIEVSRAQSGNVPSDYMRKQTLVNGERFITPELKRQEEIILTAEERMNALEYEIFLQVVAKVLTYTEMIQAAAYSVAAIDCLVNFAELAERLHYSRPDVVKSQTIQITNGRHPVVEQLLHETRFVPNPTTLSSGLPGSHAKTGGKSKSGENVDGENVHHENAPQLILLTGPNMAGKSVYIRQVALITLMSQIGSFVSAQEAELSVVDRIFVRSGASDVISQGMSTFMVEMVETSLILNNATSNSLIVMDEIGRGTSTFDGISIAWAVAEYLVTQPNVAAKTLFATHYHELQELQTLFPTQIRNMHMAIEKERGKPVFLHTLMDGGASHSFGIAVAELAGVPKAVTKRAQELLKKLEEKSSEDVVKSQNQNSTQNSELKKLQAILEDVDINNTTPLQALELVSELKKTFDR